MSSGRLPAAAAAVLLLAGPARGQIDTTRVVALDSLRVTAVRTPVAPERVPAALTSVGAGEIRDGRAGIGLDESLRRVPGLLVNNRYNFSLGNRVAIRGLGARAAFGVRGIRVIADGVPLTMPDGQTNLNNLDLGAAGRIDVIRGPASSLHGNAAGGVISVSSEAPPARFSTAARVLAGDAGRGGGADGVLRGQIRMGGPVARGGWLLSLGRLEADGYRDWSRGEQTQVNLVARQAIGSAGALTVTVNGVDAPVARSPGALPRDSVARDRRMAWPANVRTRSGEAVRQVQGGVAWVRDGGSRRWDISVYGLGRSLESALPFAFITLDRSGAGSRAALTVRPGGGVLTLTVGADAEWMRDGRRETDNAGGAPGTQLRREQTDRVRAAGPFAQGVIRLGAATDVMAGIRGDAVRFETEDRLLADGRDDSGERTLSAFSPMVGLVRRFGAGWRLWGNVASGFQTPTTTELINAPPGPGQPCCPAGFNDGLDPQRALSVEAGAQGRLGPLDLQVTAYHMDVRSTIVPFQVAGVDGREFFRNAGQTRHRGVEAEFGAPLGPHRASLSYTLNHFTFVDDGDAAVANEGNRLPGVPRHQLFAGLALRPLPAIRVDVEVERAGSYFADDANSDAARNGAATVVDLRAVVEFRSGRLRAAPFLAINNLTGERYNSSVVINAVGGRYFEPAPGRNLHFGLSLLTGDWSR